jgi:processing peptidase subunit alpha
LITRAIRNGARTATTQAPAAAAVAAKASAAAPSIAFGELKFQKENVVDVMAELPEFSFYEMRESRSYPFSECTLDRSVLIDPPSPARVTPKVEFSKLENGLKVASIDRQGLTAHVGLFVSAGSRFENASNFGVCHMTSLMAYKSTAHLSHLRTVKTLEQLGANATTSCNAGREEIGYQVGVVREFVPLVVPLLIGNVLFPRILPWEVKTAHAGVTEAQANLAANPDAMVWDMLHKAAYCNNTLGFSTVASERHMSHFTPETIRSYLLEHCAPERMALVGVNVSHEELGKWAMRSFADYNAIPMKERATAKAAYTGGDARADGATPFCHLAIGFEAPALAGKENAAAAVLRTILGEGSPASVGLGHGTGSRLSTQIVRQNAFVESCGAFQLSYTDSGLFGVYTVVQPSHAAEVTSAVCQTLKGLQSVSAEELQRAKAALRTSIHLKADDSASLLQDLGSQLVTSGTYSSVADVAAAIDAVTVNDVAATAKKILQSKPSVAAFGDTHQVPHYSAIEASLRR